MLLSALRGIRTGFRLAWLAGVLALVALTVGPGLLRMTGIDTYTVRGGSMAPAIPIGSLVFVESVEGASINAGDVITFDAPNNAVVTHRVVGRSAGDEPTFITQGDANPTPDPDMVSSDRVIGRVTFSVPEAGALVGELSTATGIVMCAAGLVALMVSGWFVDELRTNVIKGMARRAATQLAG